MSSLQRVQIGKYIEILTDYHSNGSYESLRDNVKLLSKKDYAIMVRTLNFERDDFSTDLIYVNKSAYEHLSKSKVLPDDILTNKIANPGSIYIMPDLHYPVTCGMNLFLIRFSKEVNQRYMYYCMKNSEAYIKSFAHGTTTKTITKDEVRSIDLLIHTDIEEQNRIERLLSAIDKKIENNNAINDNLAQQAKLLYDYWFTQFDFPDENDKPYRSSGGKMEWNDRMKRNIPTGWQVVTFTNIATWESNSQPPKSEFRYEPQDGYVRFIQNRDYDSNAHKTYIPLTKNLSIVDRLDILMDKYGDAGAVRYGIEGAFNVALGKINVHNTSHREYIRSYLESDGIYTYLHNSCMASTRASLSESNLANLILVMPDDVTIAKYEAILNNVRKRILKNNDEIEKLVELRDWLLPLLMNGQATIAE